MKTLKDLKAAMLQNPEFKAEYDALASEFDMARELVSVLKDAKEQLTIYRDAIVEGNQYPDGSMDDFDRAAVNKMNSLLSRICAAISKITNQ